MAKKEVPEEKMTKQTLTKTWHQLMPSHILIMVFPYVLS